jgi:hypothetical protein
MIKPYSKNYMINYSTQIIRIKVNQIIGDIKYADLILKDRIHLIDYMYSTIYYMEIPNYNLIKPNIKKNY